MAVGWICEDIEESDEWKDSAECRVLSEEKIVGSWQLAVGSLFSAENEEK